MMHRLLLVPDGYGVKTPPSDPDDSPAPIRKIIYRDVLGRELESPPLKGGWSETRQFPDGTAAIRTSIPQTIPQSIVDQTIAERGKVYGDPKQSHTNIGLSWTALLQQHYGLTLEHPLPPALVAQMMVAFKMQRSTRVFHADNYVDAHAYTKFAEDFQKPT